MPSELIIGLAGGLLGLLAAGAGLYAMARGMGYFQYLGGSHLPPGKKAISKTLLLDQFQRLNNPHNPFRIQPSGQSDLEVDWVIVNASWLFGTSWENKRYHAWLYADESRKAVRYCEEITARSAGPTSSGFRFQTSFFRGVILFQKERSALWSIRNDGSIGKIYDYKFDPMDVKGVLKRLANENGWEFVQVVHPRNASKPAGA